MRPLLLIAVFVASVVTSASAQAGLTGTWRTEESLGWSMNCCREVALNLKADGEVLTGTVTLGSYPGECEISDGVIKRDQVSFIATSKRWAPGDQWRIRFVGGYEGDDLTLLMTAATVDMPNALRKYEIKAKRVRLP